MAKKKTASESGQCKREKGSGSSGDSQRAAGGELHQIAGPAVNLSASPVYVVGPPGKAKELLAAVKIAR